MKKIVLIMLFVLFGCSEAFAGNIAEAEGDYMYDGCEQYVGLREVAAKKYLSPGTSLDVREKIYLAMLAGQDEIDVSEYRICGQAEIESIFNDVAYDYGVFFIATRFKFDYDEETNIIYKIKPEYTFEKDKITEAVGEVNSIVDDIIAGMDEGFSDIEKALYIHDYFCINYEYDESKTYNDIYNLFVNKKGICKAYAFGYGYLLTAAGIENEYLLSTEMDHMWNIAKIDGEWYNIDVMWDDKTPDKFSKAWHTNFMKSDEKIKNPAKENDRHYSWNVKYPATSTTYDEAFWNNVEIPFAYANGIWYCIEKTNKKMYECDINAYRLIKPVYSFGKWYVKGNSGSSWTNVFSGLCVYENNLYFNTADGVYVYNTTDRSIAEVWLRDAGEENKIYGMKIKDGVVYIALSTTPNVKIEASLNFSIHTHSYSTTVIHATCTADGEMRTECVICQSTKDVKVIGKLGHAFVKDIIKASYGRNGVESVKCTRCESINNMSTFAGPATINLNQTVFIYDGKRKTPSVTVKNSLGNAIDPIYYTVKYKNNRFLGEANVTVEFIGDYYEGGVNKSFYIVLKEPVLKKIVNHKNGVKLNWGKIAGAKGYEVFRKGMDGKWKKIATLKGLSNVTYIDKTAKNATAYWYSVRAYNGENKSSYDSAGKKIYRVSSPAITGLKNISKKKLKATWKKISGIAGYQVQYGTQSNFSKAKAKTFKGCSSVTQNISGLVKGRTYYVRVRAYKVVDGKKYYSDWCTAKKIKILK